MQPNSPALMLNLLLSLSLVSSAASKTPSIHVPARSLWVWNTRPILDNKLEQDKFFEFLAAPRGEVKNRISVIFFAREGKDDADEFPKLRAFIARAHQFSVRVDYLCGEADYVLPDKQKEGLDQIDSVLKYNRSSRATSRFDALQYDVEPYSLPGWPKQEILTDYLAFLDKAHKAIQADHAKLKLGCAIPRWFDEPNLKGLYKSVIDRVDYVAVMDYVDNTASFVTDGSNEVAYGTETGKEVWLGAETSELKDEPGATFYAKGNAAMEAAFAAAYHSFGHVRGFAGIAIEHYDPYVIQRP